MHINKYKCKKIKHVSILIIIMKTYKTKSSQSLYEHADWYKLMNIRHILKIEL